MIGTLIMQLWDPPLPSPSLAQETRIMTRAFMTTWKTSRHPFEACTPVQVGHIWWITSSEQHPFRGIQQLFTGMKKKAMNETPHTFRSPDNGTRALKAAWMWVAACRESGARWRDPASSLLLSSHYSRRLRCCEASAGSSRK